MERLFVVIASKYKNYYLQILCFMVVFLVSLGDVILHRVYLMLYTELDFAYVISKGSEARSAKSWMDEFLHLLRADDIRDWEECDDDESWYRLKIFGPSHIVQERLTTFAARHPQSAWHLRLAVQLPSDSRRAIFHQMCFADGKVCDMESRPKWLTTSSRCTVAEKGPVQTVPVFNLSTDKSKSYSVMRGLLNWALEDKRMHYTYWDWTENEGKCQIDFDGSLDEVTLAIQEFSTFTTYTEYFVQPDATGALRISAGRVAKIIDLDARCEAA